MNDKPSPTANDIKLPVRITDNDPCLIQDADGIVVARCFTMKEANAIIAALNTTALLAERDALREALAVAQAALHSGLKVVSEIADIDAECRAGWAHKEMDKAWKQARLALAKGGGE